MPEMDSGTRAAELVQFLLQREPSSEEQERISSFGFDYDTFLIELLCSDELENRFGGITQYLVEHVRKDMASDAEAHKMAHDLALSKEELTGLQAKLDHLSAKMIELLRHEDRIASIFEAVREIQDNFNSVRSQLESLEIRFLRSMGGENDY
jgi:hypothetical protein